MPDRSRTPRLMRAARPVVALAALAVTLYAAGSAALAGRARTWPHGVIRYHDETGMARAVAEAAARWNASGAHVRFRAVRSARDADVVLRVDDRRLVALCGRDCLGFTTVIGRPRDGRRTTVWLAGALEGNARALSVWVAAHELGHVLGLRHRHGRGCSLMSEHAFDTRCAPSLDPRVASPSELACVPAPTDVRNAARLYGGAPVRADPRCR